MSNVNPFHAFVCVAGGVITVNEPYCDMINSLLREERCLIEINNNIQHQTAN
jgi:hypothetical protein